MGAVLSLEKCRNKKIRSYSISDMIFDSIKRKETQNYFNDVYQEAEEEKQIFQSWRNKIKKRKFTETKHFNFGGTIMEEKKYNRLDMGKFNAKKSIFVSNKESLEDVIPMNWSREVLEGKKKVMVTKLK
jgi:hypothetical protein